MPSSISTGALLIAGAASGVGKSTITAGLCRSLARSGVKVAPFKAQNMSNHAAVTASGGEIGRAQAMQALAANVEPTVDMNPILIKPGPNMTSHVVVRGRELSAPEVEAQHAARRDIVLGCYRTVAEAHDVVIAEGAGGAAEINLLDHDVVNLPFAAAAGMDAILVVDIDRGGAFASAVGTVAVLPSELAERVRGVVINGFRGDPAHLGDGLDRLAEMLDRPVLGVLPHLGPVPLLGVEDALDLATYPVNDDRLPSIRVAILALPHVANPSDFDPLMLEPSLALTWARRPADVLAADLVIIPGSRATVTDLAWLRRWGIDAALRATEADVLGICGGYQMLGHSIDDPIESKQGRVEGLGLLDIHTVFQAEKVVTRSYGTSQVSGSSTPVHGYQIRFGRPERRANVRPFLDLVDGPEGAINATGTVTGTSLHGVFDSDEFRHGFFADLAQRRGVEFLPNPQPFAEAIDGQHDTLATWVETHLDMAVIHDIAAGAARPDQLPGWLTMR